MRAVCTAVLLLLLASPAAGRERPDDVAARGIRPDAIRAHVGFLADGLLEGREPGTRGYDVAARYVAAQLEGMGLRPAGDAGSWYQRVPLRRGVLDTARSAVTLVGPDGARALTEGAEWAAFGYAAADEVAVEAPLVYAGFGVTAPDQDWDDYAGVDVRGKIVVLLWGAPSRFPAPVRALHSDFRTQARNAVAHGAVGVLLLLLPADRERFPWDWHVPQVHQGEMHWLDADGSPRDAFSELRGWVLLHDRAGEALFAGSGRTLADAYADAAAGRPASGPLPGSARIRLVTRHTDIASDNVLGLLPGSDPVARGETVLFTAHLDHLGHCPPVNGDDVCHGAYDNASGVAVLLEVARAFATLPKAPRRSVAFAFVTAEEMGLLGSDYLAEHPTKALGRIVANVNLDGAPGYLYAMKDVVAIGREHSTLDAAVQRAARREGLTVAEDPMPEEVFFVRSDQFSFVKRGVPAVFLGEGPTARDPGIDGLATSSAWLKTRYHTPADAFDPQSDWTAVAEGARYTFRVGWEVAGARVAPAWNAGDFFGERFGKVR